MPCVPPQSSPRINAQQRRTNLQMVFTYGDPELPDHEQQKQVYSPIIFLAMRAF